MNRRDFVSAAAGAAAGVINPYAFATTLGPSASTPGSTRLDQALRYGIFAKLQGETVRLRTSEGETINARLSAVQDLGSNATVEQFSVHFDPLHATSLQDGIYQLEHRRAGSCQLYLSADRATLTATFALLR